MLLAACAAGAGCVELDPAPNLSPSAGETLRKLIGQVQDTRQKRDLMERLDLVQAKWPVRQAGTTAPADVGEPTPVAALREKIADVPDAKLRGEMVVQTDKLAEQWKTGNTDQGRPVGWFLLPEKVRVDSFTSFKIAEDGKPYLEARVQVLDADGNPMRTIGKFRIEMFQFAPRSADPRGERTGIWNIDIQDHEDNRKYFDVLINGYTFTLDVDGGVAAVDPATLVDAAGRKVDNVRYVVEATFIRPDGRRVYPSNYRYVDAPLVEGATGVTQGGPKKASPNKLKNQPNPLLP